MIRMPAVVAVEVASLEPWWTRWWLGVLKTDSIGRGSADPLGVQARTGRSGDHDWASSTIHGGKPSSGSGSQNGR